MPVLGHNGSRRLQNTGLGILPAALRFVCLFALSMVPLACGVSYDGVDAITQVARLPTENLAGDCVYELILAKPAQTSEPPIVQGGVFVVYQRGDSAVIFGDPTIRQLLQAMHFSLILANQCNAATYSDFQSDPYMGPGRELFQALIQFANQTGHPELANANVVLYGFSAAGVLAAEMATYAPSRTLGVISYAAGSAHQDFPSFTPSTAALGVPSLFLASSQDENAGTTRSLDYFNNGRQLGAVWAYGVQEGVGHCCNASTEPMIISWLPAIIELRGGGSGKLIPVGSNTGLEGFFVCSPDGTIDAQHDEDCSFTSATIDPSRYTFGESVWLPRDQAAEAWLTWVTQSQSQQ